MCSSDLLFIGSIESNVGLLVYAISVDIETGTSFNHEIVFWHIIKEQRSKHSSSTSEPTLKILATIVFSFPSKTLTIVTNTSKKSMPKNSLKFNKSFIITSLSILVSTPFSNSKIAIGMNAAIITPRHPKIKPSEI